MKQAAPALARWAEQQLGHSFADPQLLARALTHSSAASGPRSNQRLEFLGDRVLGCAVAAMLYGAHEEAEGRLTSRLHALVEGPANAEVARRLGVPDWLVMEPSARAKGLHLSDNALGDAAEALVAALFLDGGWPVAEEFVRREWGRLAAEGRVLLEDPKSRLQQWALKEKRGMPSYIVIDRSGPDHAPRFTIEVAVSQELPAHGEGASKQEAEKAAALALLGRLGAP